MTDVGGKVNTVAFACLDVFLKSQVEASSRFEGEVFDTVSAVRRALFSLRQQGHLVSHLQISRSSLGYVWN